MCMRPHTHSRVRKVSTPRNILFHQDIAVDCLFSVSLLNYSARLDFLHSECHDSFLCCDETQAPLERSTIHHSKLEALILFCHCICRRVAVFKCARVSAVCVVLHLTWCHSPDTHRNKVFES